MGLGKWFLRLIAFDWPEVFCLAKPTIIKMLRPKKIPHIAPTLAARFKS